MDENNYQFRVFSRPVISFLITRWQQHISTEQSLSTGVRWGLFLSWAEAPDLRSLLSCLCFVSPFNSDMDPGPGAPIVIYTSGGNVFYFGVRCLGGSSSPKENLDPGDVLQSDLSCHSMIPIPVSPLQYSQNANSSVSVSQWFSRIYGAHYHCKLLERQKISVHPLPRLDPAQTVWLSTWVKPSRRLCPQLWTLLIWKHRNVMDLHDCSRASISIFILTSISNAALFWLDAFVAVHLQKKIYICTFRIGMQVERGTGSFVSDSLCGHLAFMISP